ncbi:MAG TPA: hypothetical protein VFP56_08680 [Candidatus Limnocylindrales bacterium]|nr:hypothetical protein [Candidatus Limnocylindrales bacterium]
MDERRAERAPVDAGELPTDAGKLPADEAVFAPARLPRRRVPVAAVGIGLAIAALAVVGSLDRLRETPRTAEKPASSRMIDVPAVREVPPPAFVPVPVSAPLLDLAASTSEGRVFVHGDVFTRDAVVVIVSIADAAEDVLDVRSVDMPGGSTAFRLGPNERFLEAFEVEGWPATQVAWVMANAYDKFGMIIASAREALSPAISSQLPIASRPPPRPVVSSEPGPIILRARRNAATVYVHGDVFAERVTWIYVALQDAGGRVAGWTSVSMPDPGPASAVPGGGPPMLFDVELGVPFDTYPGTIFVFAHAHDAAGALVGTAQLELAR